MAATEIVLFKDVAKLPGFVKEYDGPSNVEGRSKVNQLSLMGKVWRTIINGKETALTKVDNDGDKVPVQVIRLIVVQANKARSRAYYGGDFDPKKPTAPDCWSSDGETPDESVPEKQASRCAKCKQSQKGSKINPKTKKETTACATFKRLAVVPEGLLQLETDEERKQMPPMMLKLPQTSVWDANADEQGAKGWFAWDQFTDMLRQKGVPHTGMVVTKAKFDPEPAHPKVLFSAERFLSKAEYEIVKPMFLDAEIAKLLMAPENEVAANRTKGEDADLDEPAPKRAKPAADAEDDPPPKKKAAPAEDEDDPPPKKKKPVVVEDDADDPPPKKKASPVDDSDDDPPPKKKAAPVDDDADDPPPKKKAAPVEDAEDDPPPKKKKPVVEDAEDDPPPKKKKAVVDDADDDPPAKPASKKDPGLKTLLEGWPDDDTPPKKKPAADEDE